MSFKSKFLNIITFGHVGRKAKKEAEKKAQTKSTELTLNTVEMPDVTALIDGLGGCQNIGEIVNTMSTITVGINDFNKIDFEQIKKVSKRGIVRSKENITIIVGDCASALKEKIIEYKNK